MVRRFNTDNTFWHPENDVLMNNEGFVETFQRITWRFTKSVQGQREQGIKVHTWPAYRITRSRDDWAWRLDSMWVTYRTVTDHPTHIAWQTSVI
jgi:hypothetical protein